jgi:hypothetical protein
MEVSEEKQVETALVVMEVAEEEEAQATLGLQHRILVTLMQMATDKQELIPIIIQILVVLTDQMALVVILVMLIHTLA